MSFPFPCVVGRRTPVRFPTKNRGFSSIAVQFAALTLLAALTLMGAAQARAQYTPPPPPPPPDQAPAGQAPAEQAPAGAAQAPPALVAPKQLDQMVQRIALYPDPLLAQVLTAATYWQEIPDAAGWADQHANLHGDALAQAIQEDNLPWDPSVLALLPFPSVLDMMAQDPDWTGYLGNAVLTQKPDVMDAVQRMRQEAYNYGYLRSNPYDSVVNSDGYVEINPVNPAYLYVPTYAPGVVFAAPAPGFAFGGAIRFGPAIVIGGAFAPWGWGGPGFGWRSHTILIDHAAWNRGWGNRGSYVHPYARGWARPAGPRVERHAVRR
jgi:hypothetical protein